MIADFVDLADFARTYESGQQHVDGLFAVCGNDNLVGCPDKRDGSCTKILWTQ
jgi:hypothetical protein